MYLQPSFHFNISKPFGNIGPHMPPLTPKPTYWALLTMFSTGILCSPSFMKDVGVSQWPATRLTSKLIKLSAKACGHTLVTMALLIPSAAPIVSASITSPTGPFTVGQSYTFTCTAIVTGAGTMSTTTITWIHPNGSVTSVTGSSLDLSLNPLQVSDAGQYTCNVSVSSPLLTGPQSATDTYTISVQGKRWKFAISCGRSRFMSYKFNSGTQSNGQTVTLFTSPLIISLEMEMGTYKVCQLAYRV